MGLAHLTAQDGDVICILVGGKATYVLRAIEDALALSIQTRLEMLMCVVMRMGLWTER